MLRAIVSVVAAGAAALGLSGFGSGSGQAASCPVVKELSSGTALGAARAGIRVIPPAYHAETPGNGWARYPDIVGVLSLNPTVHPPPGVTRLRQLVLGRCAPTVISRSWALIFNFPAVKVAGEPTQVAYLADTRGGWRLWFKTGL